MASNITELIEQYNKMDEGKQRDFRFYYTAIKDDASSTLFMFHAANYGIEHAFSKLDASQHKGVLDAFNDFSEGKKHHHTNADSKYQVWKNAYRSWEQGESLEPYVQRGHRPTQGRTNAD
jgi:hypothetical protein